MIHSRFLKLFLTAAIAAVGFSPPKDLVGLVHDPSKRQFTVEIGPVDLPSPSAHAHHGGGAHSHSGMYEPPVTEVRVPADGYINGFDVEVSDSAGNSVPRDVIHHINFIDPSNRELFIPISQRMLAVGKETGGVSLPFLLFGYPVRAGQPMIVSAMLHNPHKRDFRAVNIKVRFSYSPKGRPWPVFTVYPFQIDVLFPHGDKSFDLPPGKTVRSYEARPALEGRIVAISGHVHENATSISLTNATTGKVIWSGRPVLDASGKVVNMPVTRYTNRMGIKLEPKQVYRVSVEYMNTTSDTIRAGGMGVIGGVFLPSKKNQWPKAQPADPLYSIDRAHYLKLSAQLGDTARQQSRRN